MPSNTGAQRVRRRRDRMRAAGLRPVQIWVPDARADGFAQECERQARLVRETENASRADEAAWADASDASGWTA